MVCLNEFIRYRLVREKNLRAKCRAIHPGATGS